MDNENWEVVGDMKSKMSIPCWRPEDIRSLKRVKRVTSILRWLNSNTPWALFLILSPLLGCGQDLWRWQFVTGSEKSSAHVIKFLLGDFMLINEEYPGWAWPDLCAIHWDRVYSAAHTNLELTMYPRLTINLGEPAVSTQDKLFKIGLKPLLSSESWRNSKHSLPIPAVLGNAEDYAGSWRSRTILKAQVSEYSQQLEWPCRKALSATQGGSPLNVYSSVMQRTS